MTFLQIATPTAEELEVADSLRKAKIAAEIDTLSHMSGSEVLQTLTHYALELGLKILVALVIFIVGRWIIKRIIKLMNRIFEKRHVDPSIRTFLTSLVKVIMIIFLVMTIVDTLGIKTTSLLAIFAAAGLALGMALSGTLQNFAGGVMVLLIKPYRVGDYIEAQGQSGTVKSIQLFNTVITTGDNKTIYIPNGAISSSIVNNYNIANTRRVEWIINISYGDDVDKAKKIAMEILSRDKRILKDPAPMAELYSLSASSVDIIMRGWVNASDYWGVFFDVNREVYVTFPEQGIHFPFDQIDVHITKED